MRPIALVSLAGFGAGIVGTGIILAFFILIDGQRRIDSLMGDAQSQMHRAADADAEVRLLRLEVRGLVEQVRGLEARLSDFRRELDDLRRREQAARLPPPPPAPLPPPVR